MTDRRASIEDVVGRVLSERAAELTSVPDYLAALAADQPALPRGTVSRIIAARRTRAGRVAGSGPLRSFWAPALLAALLIGAVVLGVALAVPARRAPAPAVTPHTLTPRCVITSSGSLDRAIEHGAIGTQDGLQTPISLSSDGTVLGSTGFGHVSVKIYLFQRTGAVETVWSATAGQQLLAVANPVGAIDPDHAVFELTPATAHAPAYFVVYDRQRHVTTVTPYPRGWTSLGEPDTAPTTSGDHVHVAMQSTTSAAQQLVTYRIAAGASPQLLSREPRSGLIALLPVGRGDLTLARSGGAIRVNDSTEDPAGIPNRLAAAVRDGSVFASDGTTLRWSEDGPRSHYLWHWTAGDPEPSREQMVLSGSIAAVVGPLVVTDAALVLDTRSERAVKLPPSTSVDQVAGGYATVTTARAVALVPVSSIVPAHC